MISRKIFYLQTEKAKVSKMICWKANVCAAYVSGALIAPLRQVL